MSGRTSTGRRARRWLGVVAVLTVLGGFLAVAPVVPAAAAPTDDLVGVEPFRALDTRNGTGGRFVALRGQESIGVDITGPGVPAGAKAVSLNVTVTQPQGSGHVTAYPCGRARPLASNLNFTPGLTVANAVIAGVGTGDSVCFFTSAPTHLIVDVNGYLPTQSTYQALTPYRVVDTRPSQEGPLLAGQLGRKILAAPGQWAAASLNVTAVNASGGGHITVYPCGADRPTASNLNFVPGQTVPNAVVSAVGADGGVCFYTSAKTHLVVDVVGYFPSGAKFTAGVPNRVLDSRFGLGLLRAGQTVSRQLARPGEAVAVAMNVTVTGTRGSGYLTVYPCSVGRPLASNLNFTRGRTVPNMVWSQVDDQGRVCFYTSQATHLIIDVTGRFSNISPPGPVTALRVGERTGSSISLSWTNPSDMDLAEVAVRRAAGTVPPSSRWSGTEVVLASPLASAVTDTGLAADSPYSYAVFTTDAAGNENPVPATVVTSTLDTTAPGRVSGLSAVATSPGSVELRWHNPADDDLAEVVVRRAEGRSAPASPTEGTGVPLDRATAITVTDTGLAAETTYSYAVFTADDAGNVQPTPTTVSVTTADGTAPGQVTGLSVTAATETTIDLSWTNPTDPDLAEVIVRRAAGASAPGSATSGTAVPLPTATANSVTDTGLEPGTTYSYAVFTRDAAGNTSSTGASVSAATGAEQEEQRQFRQVATGLWHSCGLDGAGMAWCWGSNRDGMLGDGSAEDRATPVPVSGGRTFTEITAGWYHTCALGSDGTAWCWGTNDSGALGDGSTAVMSSTPVAVSGGHTFSQMDAGSRTTCAVDTAGQAWCWGYNDTGQVGNNTTTTARTPTAVRQGTMALRSVAVGAFHTCGLDSLGEAWCWGSNQDAKLGDGSTATRLVPAAVAGGRVFAQIDAGSRNTCAVDTSGRAWCWGSNEYGQLGNGSWTSSATPAAVSQGTAVLHALAVGSSHACAVDAAGKAWCWGSGESGKLGDGSGSSMLTPAAVEGAADYTQIAAGPNHTCARTENAQFRCWGWNGTGQLGVGAMGDQQTPVTVALVR